MRKTPGQIAYEEELKIMPNYFGGSRRPSWGELTDHARMSWERCPMPRDFSKYIGGKK